MLESKGDRPQIQQRVRRDLTEPEICPSNKACLRLPGIDGKAKMSKSLETASTF